MVEGRWRGWRRVFGGQRDNTWYVARLRHQDCRSLTAAIDLPFTNAAHETPLVALQSFFSSLPTPTARTSALQTLTRLLLLHFAQSTNTTHLLLGTSLTSLSISLISSISQGAGFVTSSLREEVWRDNVCVVRPLREMGSKECAAWCRWNNVDVVPGGLMMNKVEGIEKLTRGTTVFLLHLLVIP